jgi:hypothetical protein
MKVVGRRAVFLADSMQANGPTGWLHYQRNPDLQLVKEYLADLL